MRKIFVCLLVSCISLFASGFGKRGPGVKPVDNELYKKECASCHFAYQPGLLNEQSWRFVMGDLANHYGTDAEISKEKNAEILNYLSANSSEKAWQYKRSARLTKSMQPGVLYKSITEIPYHIKKHRKIEKWMITQKEVRTLANCTACHRSADKGYFGKRDVEIPNYGRWRD